MRLFLTAVAVAVTALGSLPAVKAQGGADFRAARWGMTDAEVRATEQGVGEDRDSGSLHYDVEVFGREAFLDFYFAERYLTAAGYYFAVPDAREGRALLRDVVRVLRSKYGDEVEVVEATDRDLLVDRGEALHRWTTDRTDVRAVLYRSEDFLYAVTVDYETRVDSVHQLAVAALSSRLFAHTDSGRADWRVFMWGDDESNVLDVMGRPHEVVDEPFGRMYTFDARVGRKRATEFFRFGLDGRLLLAGFYIPPGSGPSSEELARISSAVELAFGPGTRQGRPEIWRTGRGGISLAYRQGMITLGGLSAAYEGAMEEAAGSHADDF